MTNEKLPTSIVGSEADAAGAAAAAAITGIDQAAAFTIDLRDLLDVAMSVLVIVFPNG